MCSKCKSSGILFMFHKETKAKFVFRCDCTWGMNKPYPEYKGILLAECEFEKEPDADSRGVFQNRPFKGLDKIVIAKIETEDDDEDVCPF